MIFNESLEQGKLKSPSKESVKIKEISTALQIID